MARACGCFPSVPLWPTLTAACGPCLGWRTHGAGAPPDSSPESPVQLCSRCRPYLHDLNSQCLLHVNGTLSGWKCESCQEHWAPSCLSETHYQRGLDRGRCCSVVHARRVMNNENPMDWRQTQLAGRASLEPPYHSGRWDMLLGGCRCTPQGWRPAQGAGVACSSLSLPVPSEPQGESKACPNARGLFHGSGCWGTGDQPPPSSEGQGGDN